MADKKKSGHDNLIPLSKRTKEAQREIQRKGGKASAKKAKKRLTFREIFTAILATDMPKDIELTELAERIRAKNGSITIDQAMGLAMAYKATQGSEKAFELVRDTIGEKPTDKLDLSSEKGFEITVKYVE
ncbi:MAG: hypothetical protein M0R40_00605 [Firmicutes bacterium]|nr:hypothetical protein [Bacillota bacterium]